MYIIYRVFLLFHGDDAVRPRADGVSFFSFGFGFVCARAQRASSQGHRQHERRTDRPARDGAAPPLSSCKVKRTSTGRFVGRRAPRARSPRAT